MPPQARVGDASMVPADAHGCPACPHPAVGPAISGSPNVLTNGLPSVRVGDSGVHAACCGPNKWNAKTGSRSVLINGRSAHRLNDLVNHCGGIGKTIAGSNNVSVGDNTNGLPFAGSDELHKLEAQVLIDFNMYPADGVSYEVTDQSGVVIHKGKTNENGWIIVNPIKKGRYSISILGGWLIREVD